jgi:uncharacterized membrane protein YqhA
MIASFKLSLKQKLKQWWMKMMRYILEKSRYLILLAVISALAAATGAFFWGAWKTAAVLMQMARADGNDSLVAISLIELMDKFLIAIGLYIFAVGIYELFLGELKLPEWLTVHNLQEVKSRLSSIIILVMAIVFLEHLVEWKNPQETMYLAIAITLVASTLVAFSYFGNRE